MDRQTHMSENFIYPQLCWWVITIKNLVNRKDRQYFWSFVYGCLSVHDITVEPLHKTEVQDLV